MKILLLSLLAAASAVVAPAADAPSIAGKWQVHNSIAGNESDMACTFTQKDDTLGGSCVSERGTVEISGKVAGNKVTFTYKSEYSGTPLTVNYNGTLDASKAIKGSMEVPEFSVAGDFTATPSR